MSPPVLSRATAPAAWQVPLSYRPEHRPAPSRKPHSTARPQPGIAQHNVTASSHPSRSYKDAKTPCFCHLLHLNTGCTGQVETLSAIIRRLGLVAQSVEQRIENPCVGGSIPPRATKNILDEAPVHAGRRFFWEIKVLVSGLLSVHFPLYSSTIASQADLLGVPQATVANDLKLIRGDQ